MRPSHEHIIAQLKEQVAKYDRAIEAMSELHGELGRGGYRGISPEGRRKISRAMKARWTKVREDSDLNESSA